MMLPSGNDAAQSLAIYFGNYVEQMNGRETVINSKNAKANMPEINANINEEDYPMSDSEEENETEQENESETI